MSVSRMRLFAAMTALAGLAGAVGCGGGVVTADSSGPGGAGTTGSGGAVGSGGGTVPTGSGGSGAGGATSGTGESGKGCGTPACAGGACEGDHLWSRRVGGTGFDFLEAVGTKDDDHVMFAGGFKEAIDFPTGQVVSAGGTDILVGEADASGAFVFARAFGDTGDDTALFGAVDGQNNLIVLGYMSGTIDFGGGPLTAEGNPNVFVLKLDAQGNHVWSKRFGSGWDEAPDGLAVDHAGNVVLSAHSSGTLDFGGGPLESAGKTDLFLAKLDPSGNHLWSRRFGDAEAQNQSRLAVDGHDDILVLASGEGSIDFGGGALQSAADYDVFLAKLDPEGNHLQSARFGGAGWDYGEAIAADAEDHILIGGSFSKTIDLGCGPLSNGYEYADGYLAKLDSSGRCLWSKSFGGKFGQWVTSLAIDSGCDVLVGGSFGGAVDFGGGVLTPAGPPEVDHDMFLVKLTPSGDHLWSKSFGDGDLASTDAIAVDSTRRVVFATTMSTSIDFGGGPLTTEGKQNAALVELSP